MKAFVLSAAVLLSLLAIPAPAQAHETTCAMDDPPCVAGCLAHLAVAGHDCTLTRPMLTTEACGENEVGREVHYGSLTVPSCVEFWLESCPPGTSGWIIHLGPFIWNTCFN